MPTHSSRPLLNRRTFLRAGAVSIALPMLNAMLPRRACAAATKPKRLVLVARNLGLHAPFLFPEKTGLDYESTRYLKLLEEHRGAFTLFSGMSHLGYGSHHCEKGLFTGVEWDRIKNPQGDIRNSISLDQFAAQQMGAETRYANLVLGVSEGQLSWTERGIPVPAEKDPGNTFRQLFIDGSPQEVAREVRRLSHGQSILDDVQDQAKSLSKTLGSDDRDRLDLMFSSIREAEQVLRRTQAWASQPKPKVDYKLPPVIPSQNEVNERESLWYDIARLALQTDSTRVIQLTLTEVGHAKLDGFTAASHHDVSHHGKDPAKIEQLAIVEEAELTQLNRFLSLLKQTREADSTLLDQTVVISASNLGNASAHTGDNLPIFIAGGGFRHQGHVGFDQKNNQPLSNLYVRALQRDGHRNRAVRREPRRRERNLNRLAAPPFYHAQNSSSFSPSPPPALCRSLHISPPHPQRRSAAPKDAKPALPEVPAALAELNPQLSLESRGTPHLARCQRAADGRAVGCDRLAACPRIRFKNRSLDDAGMDRLVALDPALSA